MLKLKIGKKVEFVDIMNFVIEILFVQDTLWRIFLVHPAHSQVNFPCKVLKTRNSGYFAPLRSIFLAHICWKKRQVFIIDLIFLKGGQDWPMSDHTVTKRKQKFTF